jgi:hypothetical protein
VNQSSSHRSMNRTIHCVTVAGTAKNGPYNIPMFQK